MSEQARPDKEFMRGANDCVRASFATVLGIPYELLPEIRPDKWQEDIDKFLEPMGMFTVNVKLEEGHSPLNGLLVGSIESTRGGGYQHCVVLLDGEIWFDPERRETQDKAPRQTKILEYTLIVHRDIGKSIAQLTASEEARKRAGEQIRTLENRLDCTQFPRDYNQLRERIGRLEELLADLFDDFVRSEGCYCRQLIGGTNGDGEPLGKCGYCKARELLAEQTKAVE